MSWFINIAMILGAGRSVLVEGYFDYDDVSNQITEENYYYLDSADVEYYAETSTLSSDNEDSFTRVRRYRDRPRGETLSPDDIRDVKGALKQLLVGIGAEHPFTPYHYPTTQIIDYLPSNTRRPNSPSTTLAYTTVDPPSTSSMENEAATNKTGETDLTASTMQLLDTLNIIRNKYKRPEEEVSETKSATRSVRWTYKLRNNIDRLSSILESKEAGRRKALKNGAPLRSATTDVTDLNNVTTVKTTLTTISRSTKSRELDIPRLLAIIADLAKDFETNLTRKLNETLIKMSIPTCTTPTTTVETTMTDQYDANYTGAVIAKCFVCGMDISGIPQHAHCADAFAGDFIPLVPVDPSAKGKISRFRKYCKYANIRGFSYKRTQPRAIFGKWTGGCAVRWIDLSGVYTQRVCRSRLQPVMGSHFASKRMAKLERTLWNVENGCIVSPVATLVPLSRGVSLYARFHACVCSGSWCNSAEVKAPWARLEAMQIFIILLMSPDKKYFYPMI